MNITIVVGARPETIKIAPIIRELKNQNIQLTPPIGYFNFPVF
jgi:UDP-N-acetylglucosamine 2-epimerase